MDNTLSAGHPSMLDKNRFYKWVNSVKESERGMLTKAKKHSTRSNNA